VTSLRLELGPHEPFDLALDARRFVLWRYGPEVRLTLDEADVARVRRSLALLGVRTVPVPGDLVARPPLVRAVGTGLAPARLAAGDLDVLDVRVVPLGEATARALRRPVRYWPLTAGRRSRCRALLRGADVLLEVRRTAWCAQRTLRASRHTLRPVLFDSTAAARPMHRYAVERSLTRWVEG
jgi:hypothetical protein